MWGRMRTLIGGALACALAASIAAAPAAAEIRPASPTLWKVPRDRSSDRHPSFAFVSGERGAGFRCRLDSRSLEPCGSPRSYRVSPGRHRFEVFAVDSDGQLSARPAQDVFTVLREPTESPPPPLPYFGYNENWLLEDAFVEAAAASGANGARFNVSWSVVEPRPGSYRWEAYDSLYARMLAVGIRPVLVLLDSPCWAYDPVPQTCASTRPAVPPGPHALEAFSRFAGMVAERYPRARGIEVWNEPNYREYWRVGPEGSPAPPDPARYARLLAAAYDGIERANPAMPVAAAGLLAGATGAGRGMAYTTFLERMLRSGARNHFDAIAVHPYPFFTENRARAVSATVERLRSLLTRLELRRTPIWVTEVGVSTSGPEPVTPFSQAIALAAIHRALVHGPNVPVAVIHRMVDDPTAPSSREAGWGVMTAAGQVKPAYCALARQRERETC